MPTRRTMLTMPTLSMKRRAMTLPALALVACLAGGRVASAAVTYNRALATAYAATNWNKVVSDGYFWVDGGTCRYYGPGVAVPTGSGLASGVGDDCAHFVSSCLGTPSGGGLPVDQPFANSATPSYKAQYGNPSASGLAGWLVSSGYATNKTSVGALSPGDVIAYDWTGNGTIDHIVLYLGNNTISAHATSHYGVAYDWSKGTYPNEKLTYVHLTVADAVVPEPTTLAGLLLLLPLARRPRRAG